jgi:hypothetical protein
MLKLPSLTLITQKLALAAKLVIVHVNNFGGYLSYNK